MSGTVSDAQKDGTVSDGHKHEVRLDPDSAWGGAWKIAAAVAALGVLGTALAAFQDLHRFAFSYLFAYVAIITFALGGMFFALIQWLTSAGWSVTVRRIPEMFMAPVAGIPMLIFVLLFIPIGGTLGELYHWTHIGGHHGEHGEHAEGDHGGAEHGGAADDHAGHDHGGEHAPPSLEGVDGDFTTGIGTLPDLAFEEGHHAEHEHVLQKKVPYLNLPFFWIRIAIYFLLFVVISRHLWNCSVRQDADGDPQWTAKNQKWAPLGIMGLAGASSFLSFDIIMSLEPSWFSTIFGVSFFAQCMVSMLAMTNLIGLSMRSQGIFGNLVNKEHFHDLGKLNFGFLVFHAYTNFSQFMLIWYASVPEETTYYHTRWTSDGWATVSLTLVFGHFVIPFLILLSRNSKRGLTGLGVGCAIAILFHFIFCYWLVMPYETPGLLSPSWVDLACLMAVGGIYATIVLYNMTKHSLVPFRDPRLSRSIHFHNA